MRIAINWGAKGRELAVLVGIGTFLAFVGPFGSEANGQFWKVWVFWTFLVIVGAQLGEFVSDLIGDRLSALPVFGQLFITALVMTVLMTPIVVLSQGIFGYITPLRYWGQLALPVFIITVFMTGMGYLMSQAFDKHAAPEADDPGAVRQKFLNRLPQALRRSQLEAIVSEDHYLRVHTDKGSELILMRLADAVRELEGAGGLQTHRSWWVATDAVSDAKKSSGRLILVTSSGVEVPVSRTFSKAVKEAGLG